jgi:hypothetical protein
VKIPQGNIPAAIDKFCYVSVDSLARERYIGQSGMPSMVTVVKELPDLVNRLLIGHSLSLEDEDDVAFFTLIQILSV